ncbi:hypothetical protein BDY19DRAFT_994072 [Irpex rosettiformis]|uniref:Uncharacterized protein n=1 Tax=Irpex rosettiformis TaxID=378272 RepID=A0ACB8U2W8_9APHY|nr:hypothetical protein BDY19DRAFT_994072 [Irpex rosettiformis]
MFGVRTFFDILRAFDPVGYIEDSEPTEPPVDHAAEAERAKRETITQSMIHSGAGSILPEELFELLLRTIQKDDRRAQVDEMMLQRRPFDPVLREIEVMKAGPCYTLKNCALVCHYWAKNTRKFMFTDACIYIDSYRKAQRFRSITMCSQPRLVPIAEYIAEVNVIHKCSKARPFYQLVNLPRTKDKLSYLSIHGPFPDRVPIGTRDTPYWDAPPPQAARIPPSNTAYKSVSIYNLDFPSFKHATKYMRHFGDAEEIRLHNITWSPTRGSPPAFTQSLRRPNRRKCVSVHADRCTDDLLVCLHVAMMYARFPLRRDVPEDDQIWAIDLFATIRDFYYQNVPQQKDKGPPTCSLSSYRDDNWSLEKPALRFEINGFSYEYPKVTVYFECGPRRPLPGRHSFGPIRIIGMTLVIGAGHNPTPETVANTFDLTAFREQIENRCSLSFLVVAFGDWYTMQSVLKLHPTLRDPLGPTRTCMFACGKAKAMGYMKDWVGINPVTLKLTREKWENVERILPDLMTR